MGHGTPILGQRIRHGSEARGRTSVIVSSHVARKPVPNEQCVEACRIAAIISPRLVPEETP